MNESEPGTARLAADLAREREQSSCTRSFACRFWSAVRFIESGAEHTRQLDEAFENYDGDAMLAALWTKAATRPKLAANLEKYVIRPTATHCADAFALMGKPMPEIRAEASRQRKAAFVQWAAEKLARNA